MSARPGDDLRFHPRDPADERIHGIAEKYRRTAVHHIDGPAVEARGDQGERARDKKQRGDPDEHEKTKGRPSEKSENF